MDSWVTCNRSNNKQIVDLTVSIIVFPQTRESIRLAKELGCAVIVAITKVRGAVGSMHIAYH